MKRILAHVTVEIVKRSGQATGFVALPKRWIVERTFAWLAAPDNSPRTGNASTTKRSPSLRLASSRLMLRKLSNPA